MKPLVTDNKNWDASILLIFVEFASAWTTDRKFSKYGGFGRLVSDARILYFLCNLPIIHDSVSSLVGI